MLHENTAGESARLPTNLLHLTGGLQHQTVAHFAHRVVASGNSRQLSTVHADRSVQCERGTLEEDCGDLRSGRRLVVVIHTFGGCRVF